MTDPTVQPAATVILCPVDGCDWVTLAPINDVDPDTLADVFGPGVMQAVAATQRKQRVETELRDHFARHSTAKFVATITRLRTEVEQARHEVPIMREQDERHLVALAEARDEAAREHWEVMRVRALGQWLLAEQDWEREAAAEAERDGDPAEPVSDNPPMSDSNPTRVWDRWDGVQYRELTPGGPVEWRLRPPLGVGWGPVGSGRSLADIRGDYDLTEVTEEAIRGTTEGES